jgi:hypothetical protein
VSMQVCQAGRSIQIYDERRGKSVLRFNKAAATDVCVCVWEGEMMI